MMKYDDLGQPVVLEGATSYKSAGDILSSQQDLIDLQRSSYQRFVDMVIPFYMDQVYKSSYSTGNCEYEIEVEFPHYWIEKSTGTDSIEHYKKNNLSLESSLFATARITANIAWKSGDAKNKYSRHAIETDVLITKFPELTPNGALILNGVEKVLASHLEYAYKIRLDRKVSKGKEEKRLFFPIATRTSYKVTDKPLDKSTRDNSVNTVNYAVTIESGKAVEEGGQVKVRIGDKQQSYSIQTILSHCVKGGGFDPLLTRKIIGPFLSLAKNVSRAETNSFDSRFSLIDSMKAFRLHRTEREMLNKQLSFARRLIGRTLAEDVLDDAGNVVIKAGTVFNSVIADQAALYTNNVQVYNRVGSDMITVFSNNFLDSEILFSKYGISDVPDMFRKKKINKTYFEQLMSSDDFTEDNEKINSTVMHREELLGNYLLNDDIVCMINLYGEFLAGEVDEDNPDSLSVRNIVNIAELYEEALSRRFPGPINSSDSNDTTKFTINGGNVTLDHNNYNIIDSIMGAIILPSENTNPTRNESEEIDKALRLRLTGIDWHKIDCKPEQSITRNLPDSLLDLADNTSPMAQVNHRRKVSLKKVERRGGIQSMSSDTRPRVINPSHMGRFDCIESPEGANIGLVRFLTSYAKVNEYGLVTTPFFKVNHRMKKVDYTAAYYLDYDTESRYARCLAPEIAEEDKIVIELYRDYKNGESELIYTEDYPVEYMQSPTTQESVMLLSEQNSPMDNQQQYIGSYEVKGGLNQVKKYVQRLQSKHGADSYKLVFHKKDWFIEPDSVSAFVGVDGAAKTLSSDKIDLVAVSPGQIFSAVSGITPLPQFSDGTRFAMADAHQKQAIPIMGRQAARIETGTSSKLSVNASGVVVSSYSGFVKSADSTKVVLITDSGVEEVIPLPTISGSSENTAVISNVCVKPGDIVEKGDVLADSNMTSQGHLAHGVELVVAYVPFYGMNFEDSIVISDRLIKDRLLTSAHLVYKDLPLNAIKDYPMKLVRPVELIVNSIDGTFGGDLIWDLKENVRPEKDDLHYKTPESINNERSSKEELAASFFFDNIPEESSSFHLFTLKDSSNTGNIVKEMRDAISKTKRFDKNGLIKKGIRVHPNDTIAYYCELTQDGTTNSLCVRYRSMIYDGEDVGYVKDAYICVQDNVPTIRVIIGYDENIKPADKMSGRHGNKGVISNVLPEVDMPYTEDGRRVDIILTPLGIPSRMNISQLFDCELTEVLKKYNLRLQLNSMERINVPRLKKLISRDKLPVEGKVSFMNMDTGDVVSHLVVKPLKANWTNITLPSGNWCMYTYDTTIDIYGLTVGDEKLVFPSSLKTGMNMFKSDNGLRWGIQNTKSKPVEIFQNRDYFIITRNGNNDYYRDRTDFDVEQEYAIKRDQTFIRLGVGDETSRMIYLHIEKDNTPISLLGFATNGDDDKIQLYDGKTGQPFEQKSTVGVAYMIKSRHQVSHKIAARSYRSSAYDINQSPTQGKAHNGGQRAGQMELWSLAEHGAEAIMNELLSFKTDDVAAREAYCKSTEAVSNLDLRILENGNDESNRSLSESFLQNSAKDYMGIEIAQKNSPHVFKLVDAKLKSVLINMDYKNANGESLNIYENIIENGEAKSRDFRSTIESSREAVKNRLEAKVKSYNETKSDKNKNSDIVQKSLTSISSGFGLSTTEDTNETKIAEDDMGPYLPDPTKGFDDEYYLFGPIPKNSRFDFRNRKEDESGYSTTGMSTTLKEDDFYDVSFSLDENQYDEPDQVSAEVNGKDLPDSDEFSDPDDNDEN